MDRKVADLGSNSRLSEAQRGYASQLESAEAKGESGTIEVLGISRTLADLVVSVIRADAALPESERRLSAWTELEVDERIVRPAVEAGLGLMRKIEEAAVRGQPYFRFQGGLDATASTLSQTRRFERELLSAHPLAAASGSEDPLQTVEAIYQRATPPLEEMARKVAEERKLRWASLGPGRAP